MRLGFVKVIVLTLWLDCAGMCPSGLMLCGRYVSVPSLVSSHVFAAKYSQVTD